ncbi:MAG: hypothetical protein LBT94_00460 [Prevotellaceae bacterium]|jgi:hypothetical protein|nr:hypothetical protein [Prevotellaceae bacterium]
MKTAKAFLCGLTAIVCASCVQAQSATPAITAKYPDATIDSLIRAYATARSSDVTPAQALQQQLAKDFPRAYDVEWETAAGIYEAEFEVRRADYKAYYDGEGSLLMYSCEVRASELPAAVRDAAKGRYPKYRFDEAKKVHKGTAIFYKLEMERRDAEAKLVIKSDGSVVDDWVD